MDSPGCQTSAKLMLMGFGLPLYIRPTYRRFAYVVALMTCATAVPYSLDDIYCVRRINITGSPQVVLTYLHH